MAGLFLDLVRVGLIRYSGCTLTPGPGIIMQRKTGRVYRLIGISLIAVQQSCTDVSAPRTPENPQCAVLTPHTFGATTDAALTTSDCRLIDGSYIDYYETTLTAGWYLFDMSSMEFATYLVLRGADQTIIGVHDDIGHGTNTVLKVLLPAGNYILGANAYPGSTGPYNLSSASSAIDVTNCEIVFTTKGTSTTQNLETTDCARDSSYSDDYIIFLPAGRSITVTMSSSAFDSYVELYNSLGRAGFNDNSASTTNDAQLSHTSLASEFFIISARSAGGPATGAYTLSIQ